MKKSCILNEISQIDVISDKFIVKKISEEGLPILRNHIPLFYILPEDGSALIFNEISSIWEISKSSLSEIINKYEKQGLINKCSCPEDKRSVYISLKPEALYIKKKLDEIEAEILGLLFKGFDENEKQNFEASVSKAFNNVKEML
jgi:DNA-binding MarR family transcriptional regulator